MVVWGGAVLSVGFEKMIVASVAICAVVYSGGEWPLRAQSVSRDIPVDSEVPSTTIPPVRVLEAAVRTVVRIVPSVVASGVAGSFRIDCYNSTATWGSTT